MAEVKGVDTIIPANCPDWLGETVEVSQDAIVIGAKIQALWNVLGMSFIPYCSLCIEPLTWHRPNDGDLLLHCPICGRRWVMDNEWLLDLDRRGIKI